MAPSALATRYGSSHVQIKEAIHLNNKNCAQRLISEALRERISGVNPDECEPGVENAFFVADLGEVFRQNVRWKLNLPRVEPFYGMCSRGSHCGILLTRWMKPSSVIATRRF